MSRKRVLVAGIGNIFLGDDGFGVEVVRRIGGARDAGGRRGEGLRYSGDGSRLRAAGGLRGSSSSWTPTPRGEEPGTVYLIEPEIEDDGEVSLDTHGMDPVKVIKLARALGAEPTRTLVVGCEPRVVLSGEDYDEMLMELSEPVQAAVGEAVKLVESLVEEIGGEGKVSSGR